MKKLCMFLLSNVLLFSVSSVEAAYPKVECSTDGVYSQYSCNECFDGGEVKNSAVISFLDDVWLNDTENKKIMFKEEQSLPKMNALNGATFEQNPSVDEDFWEYTSELDTLYSPDFAGYVLNPGQDVSWLKSTLGSAYKANIGENVKGTNVGLLVFDLMSHNILPNDELAMNSRPHKECVLFKSAQAEAPVVEVVTTPTPDPTPEPAPETMTQVKTGPELYFMVLILSLVLAMVWSKRQTIFARK